MCAVFLVHYAGMYGALRGVGLALRSTHVLLLGE
jgi:hypothetical protein